MEHAQTALALVAGTKFAAIHCWMPRSCHCSDLDTTPWSSPCSKALSSRSYHRTSPRPSDYSPFLLTTRKSQPPAALLSKARPNAIQLLGLPCVLLQRQPKTLALVATSVAVLVVNDELARDLCSRTWRVSFSAIASTSSIRRPPECVRTSFCEAPAVHDSSCFQSSDLVSAMLRSVRWMDLSACTPSASAMMFSSHLFSVQSPRRLRSSNLSCVLPCTFPESWFIRSTASPPNVLPLLARYFK